MINSTLDILYLSLAVGFIVLVVFLCISLMYMAFVLRDVAKVTEKVRSLVDKVNDVVLSPMRMLNTIFDQLKPFIESLRERGQKIRSRKRPHEEDEEA